MKYDLFLFDLDDTLLDFKESERLSFFSSMENMGLNSSALNLNSLYDQYKIENAALWKAFEKGQTTKDALKVERFRRIFHANKIDVNPEVASETYLNTLPQTVVLIDYAVELCQFLSARGELGIITNGISHVQTERIKNSALAPFISFVSVSEACGYAKPDVRFFEYSAKMAKKFSKASSLVVGDRTEADIMGAHAFGVDSCWFNPTGSHHGLEVGPKFQIKHLKELETILK